MNRFLLILILLSLTIASYPQKIVYEESYDKFPFPLRIDNSGIYSIASFDIEKDAFYFSSFNSNSEYEFKGGIYSKISTDLLHNKDFIAGYEIKTSTLRKEEAASSLKEIYTFKKNFLNGKSVLKDVGGNISGSNGEEIQVIVPNRNQLILKSNLNELYNEITINYPSNLACADLIGIDKNGNTFLVIEKYLSEIPLKVEREVIVISSNGGILSRLQLPSIKYLYTIKDLQIDSEGNLYHLISYPEKVLIVKWENLTTPNTETLKYSDEFNQEINFNYFLPTYEKVAKVSIENNIVTGVNRTTALQIADAYALHQYECTSANLAPNDVTAPDGDIVRTPAWLVVGWNARFPYKWGGFSTITQFDAGLANGRYAGDINTNGVSSYAEGVDCSGFVSRCWQLSYHATTSYMPSITTQYASWDDLKPGDAIHKVGHVRLFVERNLNGSFKVVEAAARNWDVSYWSFTSSELASYTPRYYNGMETNYNTQQPVLLSVNVSSENKAELRWSCNSTNIIGYRIYSSTDGVSWNLILNEDSIKTTSAEINIENGSTFFRISSVKNDSPDFTESYWSNVLGVNNYSSQKTALIVDGFERETGSWQGAGQTFVLKYGNALQQLNIGFNSVRNSELINNSFHLEDYDYIFWIIGDESTIDETFNSTEQMLIANYLTEGGNLFVSGSEIGWDLSYKGTTEDKSFYSNYLKAAYISDDAGSTSVIGVANSSLDGCSFNIGQTYEEDYPDEIAPQNGGTLSMKYSNSKGAGIQFKGNFGSSTNQSSLIYLAFPLETTANNESFNQVILKSVDYFNSPAVDVKYDPDIISNFYLTQNYPNPFNPSTKISWQSPVGGHQTLKVYDILGNEVATLVDEYRNAGSYEIEFNVDHSPLANGSITAMASGIYIYRIAIHSNKLRAGNFVQTKKMILLK